MPPKWVLDDSVKPVLVIALDDPSGREPPDLASLMSVLERVIVLTETQRIRLVMDLTGASPDAERRRRMVTFLRERMWGARERIDAFAIVAPSPLLRGAITAMRWFFPERMLHSETFDAREPALRWIRAVAARGA